MRELCLQKFSSFFLPEAGTLTERREYMNSLTIKGNWKEMSGKLKQQFANLTDDDLLFVKGKEDELSGRLQKKLGKTKDDIKTLIEKL
jgi:uncharacterized protein YjbJ (UPF0337 family)